MSSLLRPVALLGLLVAKALAACSPQGELPYPWPPVAGEGYPDLELQDFRGESVRLSSFRGKVILVEPIGMT